MSGNLAVSQFSSSFFNQEVRFFSWFFCLLFFKDRSIGIFFKLRFYPGDIRANGSSSEVRIGEVASKGME